MADNLEDLDVHSVAAWAKRCYLAGRAVMDNVLRPYDLGATQWFVLHRLAEEGPTMQRELMRLLEVERATLSSIVGTLVRKGLVEQVPDRVDQRQKRLRITEAGATLWRSLPDLTFIRQAAFGDLDKADLEIAVRVLRTATERLGALSKKETMHDNPGDRNDRTGRVAPSAPSLKRRL